MKVVLINIVIICFVIASPVCAVSGEFGPWIKDVRIGDENVILLLHPPKKKDSEKLRPVLNLYNGPQTGAFFLIRFFQVCISPQDGPNCRFDPVCSVYAKRAVERFGAFVGAVMAGERLIRCNPYYPPGKDPVPESLTGGY